MEPKGTMEIIFSPEGLLILPFAAVIDIIGIILVIFLLDDFWITDIIAWSIIGTWSYFRSQVVPEPAVAQMPSIGAKKEWAEKTEKISRETKKTQKTAKAAKWAKRVKWFEFIPYVGALPLWSISVYMTIKYS